ncbi:hypothetical protein [Pediococcus pentosaceus]|uniref:Cardiolipin synthase N-terminal domain-containing protein n=1 Tax=Pediococcus pentosaceus TaxID=1255 RepID=A0AB73HC60_PEDPE|nr:hypothetical protein [Pediococcus pentosaceus]MBF7114067.1 hypothetical protein [Pediococcus pentosaceus]MCM6792276.1 hypothetical protein [Pediococcus pentosaceus]MCM6809572.1 hypothetical protein [Pediococcus pentosaceus]MCM6818563.1 hypothetical protein [Pediococcus pentosaceus]MDN3206249.1 hypothetical protein [Pediococcus pentosaceus]
MDLKILIPVIVILVGYLGFLLNDLIHIPATKNFSKWTCGLICCIAIPLGGIVYYFWGRVSDEEHDYE